MHLNILEKIRTGKTDFSQAELKRTAIFAPKLTQDKNLLSQLIPYLEGEVRSDCLEDAFVAACTEGKTDIVDFLAQEIERLEGKERVAGIIAHDGCELIKDSLGKKEAQEGDVLALHLMQILERVAPHSLNGFSSAQWLNLFFERGAAKVLKFLFDHIREDGEEYGNRVLESEFDNKGFSKLLRKAAYSDNPEMVKLLLDTASSFSPDGKPYYYARDLASSNRSLYADAIRGEQNTIVATLFAAAHKLGGKPLLDAILSDFEVADEIDKNAAVSKLVKRYQQGNAEVLHAGQDNLLLHVETHAVEPLPADYIEAKYQALLREHGSVENVKKDILAELDSQYSIKNYDEDFLSSNIHRMNIVRAQELLALAEKAGGKEFVRQVLKESDVFWQATA